MAQEHVGKGVSREALQAQTKKNMYGEGITIHMPFKDNTISGISCCVTDHPTT